jgi:hypothetical protein
MPIRLNMSRSFSSTTISISLWAVIAPRDADPKIPRLIIVYFGWFFSLNYFRNKIISSLFMVSVSWNISFEYIFFVINYQALWRKYFIVGWAVPTKHSRYHLSKVGGAHPASNIQESTTGVFLWQHSNFVWSLNLRGKMKQRIFNPLLRQSDLIAECVVLEPRWYRDCRGWYRR